LSETDFIWPTSFDVN